MFLSTLKFQNLNDQSANVSTDISSFFSEQLVGNFLISLFLVIKNAD